jgi:hypothetical protein
MDMYDFVLVVVVVGGGGALKLLFINCLQP